MITLLSNIKKEDVSRDPYPHIHARNLLDPALNQQLLAEFPPIEVITQTSDWNGNSRYSLFLENSLKSPRIGETTKEFLRANASKTFFHQFLDLFEEDIKEIYPQLDLQELRESKVGMKRVDEFDKDTKVLISVGVSLNTPTKDSNFSSVKGPHVDGYNRLCTCLYYLRDPEDDSKGRSLIAYKHKGRPKFEKAFARRNSYIPVKEVPYENNAFFLFFNCLNSLHGVSPPETPAKLPRRFLSLSIVLDRGIVPIDKYQVGKMERRLKRLRDRVLAKVLP